MAEKAFSEEFKEIRENMDMSQKEISTHLGVPKRTWQDWEHGLRTPPKYVLEWIKRILEYEKLEKQMNEGKPLDN